MMKCPAGLMKSSKETVSEDCSGVIDCVLCNIFALAKAQSSV